MTRPTNLGRTWPSRMVSSGPVTITIGDLADIDLSGISDGDIIIWDDATDTWIVGPQTGGGSIALDDLTDVSITSATASDRLVYNGSVWVNSSAMWVPVMVEDGATGLWYVAVTGDGDAVMTEVS